MEECSLAALTPELLPDAWRENVAAVVMDAAGRVLLGLGTGHNAYWHFPQGGVTGKESPEEALRRELQEEAGLEPHRYRILARYGGLRYRYRKSNDKSARWRGQEQTWYFVLCYGEQPPTDHTRTDEFCALTWVPWCELTPELFAPFKRKVVAAVLAHFFPPHLPEESPVPYLLASLTPRRYQLAGKNLDVFPCDDRTLFGGGKEEMAQTLSRLAISLRFAHKRAATSTLRLLVLLHGADSSGRKQCARRLAASLDPLHLRVAEANLLSPGLPWGVLQALPPAGGVSLIIHQHGDEISVQEWKLCERWLEGQGVSLLKLYLHSEPKADDNTLLTLTDSPSAPWHIIPAARRWYRDYIVALLVESALSPGQFPELA